MPRRRTVTPAQQAALDELAQADLEYRTAKASALQRAKAIAAHEIAEIRNQRDQLAYRAYRGLGLSKAHLSEEGLHTTAPQTFDEILARFEPPSRLSPVPIDMPITAGPEFAELTPGRDLPRFSWDDKHAGLVDIHYRNFPTVSTREGFPKILTGQVRRSEDAPSKWEVVTDPTDTPTQYGPIPGYLHDEIDRPFFADEESEDTYLPALLTRWASESIPEE